MRQRTQLFTGALSILILYLVILLLMLIMVEMGPARATIDASTQPIVTATDNEILLLKDAPPQRDITKQRFAPFEATQ